jgi:primosomal protein N' (replication factor Y)
MQQKINNITNNLVINKPSDNSSLEKIFKVILPLKINQAFFYKGDDNFSIGDIILVSFGKLVKPAIIFDEVTEIDFPKKKLKPIKSLLKPKVFSKDYLDFLNYLSNYNMVPLGLVVNLALPNLDILSYQDEEIIYNLANIQLKLTQQRNLIKGYFDLQQQSAIAQEELINKLSLTKTYLTSQVNKGFLTRKKQLKAFNDVQDFSDITAKISLCDFSNAQQKTSKEINNYLLSDKFKVGFLHGVTGSGKTEIYFALIAQLLANSSKQILVLLPEILLTKQFIDKFTLRFGFKPDMWHSQTSLKEKKNIWYKITNGQSRFLVGVRSSLFLPFKNLGLIIVDEEHDNSYKQDDNVSYHARDMAVVRGYKEKFPILLVSATPSLESKINCQQGKYKEFQLLERYGKAILPEIKLVDMKSQNLPFGKWLSAPLLESMRAVLSKGEQTMIFMNRRGYAPLKICNSCGYRFKCSDCDSWLVEHRKTNKLECHYCDYKIDVPKTCPECNSESLISFGPGVERIKEELTEYFPMNKIALITSDESKNPSKMNQLFKDIEDNKYDIILGTQIIAKGHHFANLTVVGVIDGDIGSELQDLRCSEKMFQLLQQISGRAGRSAKEGQAIIQSYNPNSNLLKSLQNHDIFSFYDYEINKRKKFDLPPFSKFIAIIIADANQDKAANMADKIATFLNEIKELKIYGPINAPLFFLRKKYRYRILLKYSHIGNLHKIIKEKLAYLTNIQDVNIKIDIDPYNFM